MPDVTRVERAWRPRIALESPTLAEVRVRVKVLPPKRTTKPPPTWSPEELEQIGVECEVAEGDDEGRPSRCLRCHAPVTRSPWCANCRRVALPLCKLCSRVRTLNLGGVCGVCLGGK